MKKQKKKAQQETNPFLEQEKLGWNWQCQSSAKLQIYRQFSLLLLQQLLQVNTEIQKKP